MFRSNIFHELNSRRLKLHNVEILVANKTLFGNFFPEVYNSIMKHISITNIWYMVFR